MSDDPRPGSLAAARRMAADCTRCDLHRGATQTVFGEGPARAPLMLVGEQPGDREDIEGHPFVGPAGRLLDEALADAGVDRKDVYITNGVKHFKFEPRGKRRLHKKPDAGEIRACRWWLDIERELVRPQVVVAMGTTAIRSVMGKAIAISKLRGQAHDLDGGGRFVATVHPSYLLRMPDRQRAAQEYDRFVGDLAEAGRLVAEA